MSDQPPHSPPYSPRTGLPLIPKGPPLPTDRCGQPAPPALLLAVQQFNQGQYWDAHEMLEGLWRGEQDPVRSLYQGILLVGVGLHHLLRGNYHGATTKLRAGLERLTPYAPQCQGINVAALLTEARRCLQALTDAGPAAINAFDRALIPSILLDTPDGPNDALPPASS